MHMDFCLFPHSLTLLHGYANIQVFFNNLQSSRYNKAKQERSTFYCIWKTLEREASSCSRSYYILVVLQWRATHTRGWEWLPSMDIYPNSTSPCLSVTSQLTNYGYKHQCVCVWRIMPALQIILVLLDTAFLLMHCQHRRAGTLVHWYRYKLPMTKDNFTDFV